MPKRRVRRVRRPDNGDDDDEKKERRTRERRTEPETQQVEEQETKSPKKPDVEVVEAEEEVPVENRSKVVIDDNPFMRIIEAVVDKGKAVVISAGKGDTYVIHATSESEFSVGRASTRQEYREEVQTEEYREWREQWGKMSTEEKLQIAEEVGAEWEEHEEPKINMMRVAEAVREAKGIEKYKEEYNTRSKRNKIRPRN